MSENTTISESTTEPDSERTYKGDVLTLKDLLKDPERYMGAPFQVESKPKGSYGVPKSMGIIARLGYEFGNTVNFWSYDYIHGFHQLYGRTSDDLVLRILTGIQGKSMRNKFDAWAKDNLGKSVLPFSYTIGSDPEIFVEDNKGKLIPAFQFLPAKPKHVSYCAPYLDGFQAEFNIAPGGCLMGYVDYIRQGLGATLNIARAYKKEARLSSDSVREVSADVLAKTREEYVQFGCAPSRNIYNLEGNKTDGRHVPVRFAGGHIHFGCGHLSEPQLRSVVSALDHITAVSCVSLFDTLDQPIRREYYGLPGEYRTPAHGLEYRVLSNAWLLHPVLTNLVVDLARRAFSFGYTFLNGYWKASQDEMIQVVRRHDVAGARAILERNAPILNSLIESIPSYGSTAPTAVKLIMSGVESGFRDVRDIESNWLLGQDPAKWRAAKSTRWANACGELAHGKKI